MKFASADYRSTEKECNWIIDNSTVVQLVTDTDSLMITPVLNFTDFKKFRQYIDIQSEIGKSYCISTIVKHFTVHRD